MKTARACGFLIVRGDPIDSFLLMQHATRWDLPKGHVDPDETDLECARRELEEETGIPGDAMQVDPGFRFEHHYQVNDRRYGDQPVNKTLIVFLARLTRPVDIVVTEHQGYRWFDWSPPHAIQEQTINPLLEHVHRHVLNRAENDQSGIF